MISGPSLWVTVKLNGVMYIKTLAIVNNLSAFCMLGPILVSKPHPCIISFYPHTVTRQIILTRGYAHLYFSEEKKPEARRV